MKEIHIRIACKTEEVIAEIKKRNCILNEIIEPFPDLTNLEKFAVYHYWSNSESVNVFHVVGSSHPDYTGISWIDMLRIGKRMHLNLKLLAENPGYYFENRKKEPVMHYTKINDRIYISGEGNHRTAIAKVLFYFTGEQTLHGVEYNEYSIDFEMVKLYQNIKTIILKQRLPVDIEVLKKNIKREDTAGWKKDYFELYLHLKNFKTGKELILDKNQAECLLKELQSTGFIKKLFPRNKYQKFIYGSFFEKIF